MMETKKKLKYIFTKKNKNNSTHTNIHKIIMRNMNGIHHHIMHMSTFQFKSWSEAEHVTIWKSLC